MLKRGSRTGCLSCRPERDMLLKIGREGLLMNGATLATAFTSACLILASPAFAADIPDACNSTQAAVTGGLTPPTSSDVVVIRWLGNANYEFAYKGKVYLFDAYFNRTPRAHNIGFKAEDIKKAEAIFVSHAHFDHISDIGTIAKQTGAPVVGAPLFAEVAKKPSACPTGRSWWRRAARP